MRRSSPRQLRKLHLIICEDTKSSQYYMQGLKEKFGINIKIEKSEGTDIGNVIRTAGVKSKRTGLNKEMQQVYCLFDKDETTDDIFFTKIRESEAKGYINAYSIPCYEYWLLLHLVKTDRPFTNAQECCNAFVDAYNKKFGTRLNITDLKRKIDIFEDLFLTFQDAFDNANSFVYSSFNNPYTNMHKIIEELLKHKTKN